MSLILTAWCIAVALGSVFAVGLPIQWLIGGRRRLHEPDWVRAPLMGLAAIIVVLSLLTFLDVTVRRATVALWVVTAALWIVMARRRAIDRTAIPLTLAAVAAAVLLVHGIGLVWAGANVYVGRGWADQVNYVAIAQFLLDDPFSRTLADVGMRPYLLNGIFHKQPRIGQSVVNGFLAATAGQDAKTMFEPTILLAPALVFLALFELWRALSGAARTRLSLVACAGASLLPAVAILHLEGFLSQGLSLPFLLLWPVLARDVVAAPGARALVSSGLVSAALTVTYPEVLPLIVAMAAGGFALAALRSRDRLGLARGFALVLLPPLLWTLTPVLQGFRNVAGYLGRSAAGGPYPWALQLEGVARLWAGDLVQWLARPLDFALGMVAAALTCLGYVGLGLAVRRLWRLGWEPRDGGPLALGAALALYALTPVAVLAAPGRHPYQFYKLAFGVAPVVALGLAFLAPERLRRPAVSTMLVLALAGTAGMAVDAGRGRDTPRSMGAHDLMTEEAKKLTAILRRMRDRDLALLERDVPGRPPGVMNAWFAYLGRENRVWLGNTLLSQGMDKYLWALAQSSDLARLPSDAVFLTSARDPWAEVAPGARLLWEGDAYRLWTTTQRGPWATLVWADNPNGLEQVNGRRFAWLGVGDMRLLVLAGQPGMIRFSAEAWIGSAGGTTRHVRIRSSAGWDQTVAIAAGHATFRVAVSSGIQEIRLTVLERDPPLERDPRSLTLGLLDLRLRWSPEP